jgi:uncharacterized membrane protein YczE
VKSEVVAPLPLAASTFIFFSSIVHSRRSDVSTDERISLIIAAVCLAPWMNLVVLNALSPEAAYSATYIFMLIGSIIASLSIGFFLAARVVIGGWRNDALAVGVSVVFGGLVYLPAIATS